MALNREMEQSGQVYPIYLEPEAMAAVHVMESLQLPVLQQNNYSSFYAGAAHPHVVIGTKRKEQVAGATVFLATPIRCMRTMGKCLALSAG